MTKQYMKDAFAFLVHVVKFPRGTFKFYLNAKLPQVTNAGIL